MLHFAAARRFAARVWAWPLAWPSPSGPEGRQRSPGPALDAGEAAPDNARRSGPGDCDLRPVIGGPGARMTAWCCSCRAAPGPLRRVLTAPGGGAAVRGDRRARRATARKGASEAAAPQRRDPQRPRPLTAGHPAAQLTPPVLAPGQVAGLGRQAWRAGGAPLKP